MSKKIVSNKNARRNYDITDTFEAGIVLKGSEVKSLRNSKVNIDHSFARFSKGELWLISANISHYDSMSTHYALDPERDRKLLLKNSELEKLELKTKQLGLSIIPLSMYFKNGKVKVELGIGKGKKLHDKRQDIAKKDANREAQRALKNRNREA